MTSSGVRHGRGRNGPRSQRPEFRHRPSTKLPLCCQLSAVRSHPASLIVSTAALLQSTAQCSTLG